MKIVTSSALQRGAVLVDYALAQKWERRSDISLADTVGIVAAYIARGGMPCEIEQDLGEHLSPEIGRRAAKVYRMFEDYRERGLWVQGGAGDDIKFTHPTLDRAYPNVNEEHERFERSARSF